MTAPEFALEIAEELRNVPGVLAVMLGGSRALGTADEDSDWDFALYYRDRLDTEAIRGLGWEGQVFEPGDWGLIHNGGAWLWLDGVRVDLIYRDLDQVEHWTRRAEEGQFQIHRLLGFAAGIPTYLYPAELALGLPLVGHLIRPAFPDALRASAPPAWYDFAAGAMYFARSHARRGERAGVMANAGLAVVACGWGRMAARGEWIINDKRLVEKAGLGEAEDVLAEPDLETLVERLSTVLVLPPWGPPGKSSTP